MVRLTAIVCAHNQEAQLSRCLRRLSFCDEIVVVADRCTDRSAEIARRQGAVVVSGIFPLEAQRRAAGEDAARGDWILEINPDEEVSSALGWEIRATLQMHARGDWFDLPVENRIGGMAVRGGWTSAIGGSRAPRLYRPGHKAWVGGRVAQATMKGVRGGSLKGALTRQVASDSADLMARAMALAAQSAEDLADSGAAGRLRGAVWRGVKALTASYAQHSGWREGRHGVLLAMASALQPLQAHLRACEILQARAAAEAASDLAAPRVVGLAGR